MWKGAPSELAADGHDVVWVGNWPKDPGDQEILAFAWQECRVLVTLDKDFGELAVAFGKEHAGIVRLVNFSVRQQATICKAILAGHAEELEAGAIVTAEPGRLRIRPPQDADDLP